MFAPLLYHCCPQQTTAVRIYIRSICACVLLTAVHRYSSAAVRVFFLSGLCINVGGFWGDAAVRWRAFFARIPLRGYFRVATSTVSDPSGSGRVDMLTSPVAAARAVVAMYLIRGSVGA